MTPDSCRSPSTAAPPASSSRRRLAPANAGLNVAVAESTRPPTRSRSTASWARRSRRRRRRCSTGDGSAGNPWTLDHDTRARARARTSSSASDITYVNGTTDVSVSYSVVNAVRQRRRCAGAPLRGGRPLRRGQRCRRRHSSIPARRARSAESTRRRAARGAWSSSTPWSHYQEGPYGDVFSVAGNTDRTATGFNDTTDPALVDNGVGVQWDFPSIAVTPSAPPQTVSVTWRFKHFTPLASDAIGRDARDRADRDGDRDRPQRRGQS